MPNFMGILKHMTMSARRSNTSGWKGRLGRMYDSGITSAQHPVREGPKSVHDSYPPAIIGTASPDLHIEPRRRGDRGKDAGALSLSPATSGTGATRTPRPRPPHPAPVAQWIEQAPSKRLAAGSSPAGGATRRQPERPGGISPPGRFAPPPARPRRQRPRDAVPRQSLANGVPQSVPRHRLGRRRRGGRHRARRPGRSRRVSAARRTVTATGRGGRRLPTHRTSAPPAP